VQNPSMHSLGLRQNWILPQDLCFCAHGSQISLSHDELMINDQL
jgi:hypothetical protein